MTKRLLLPLTFSLLFGCTPAAETGSDSTGGTPGSSGGSSGSGGKGGSNATGSGGSSPTGSGGSTPTGSGGAAGNGSGGSGSGGSGTGGSGTGGGSGAGGSADAGGQAETGGPAPGGSPAAALDKFVFDVACPEGTVKPAGNCGVADANARKKTKTVQFGGDPAKTYMVKLKVCAVSEQRSYTGCKAGADANFVCIDGTPNAGTMTYPTYSMAVAEPMRTYFLNSGGLRDDLAKMEYSATFEIKGGSMITFDTNGGSNPDVYTAKWKNHNYECPGAPGITQPFLGQFWYFTVESVTPAM